MATLLTGERASQFSRQESNYFPQWEKTLTGDETTDWQFSEKMNHPDKATLGAIILKVERKLDRDLNRMPLEGASISHFGAYDIHPRHLVFCVQVKWDREMALLEKESLIRKAHTYLSEEGYPAHAVPETALRIDSEETVYRDYNGNWYHYYK